MNSLKIENIPIHTEINMLYSSSIVVFDTAVHEKPEDYSQEDDAGLDLIDFYVLPHYLTAPFKKVTEKIMTEFSDLNLCPINNRQGIVIDGEGSKVICKD